MLKIKDNVDLIEKLNKSNKKEQQEELANYIESLKKLYDEMLEALNEEKNYIHYAWLSPLPYVAKKLKFKIYQLLPDETFGGDIIITKKGIKNITKEMIKYNLVEKVGDEQCLQKKN